MALPWYFRWVRICTSAGPPALLPPVPTRRNPKLTAASSSRDIASKVTVAWVWLASRRRLSVIAPTNNLFRSCRFDFAVDFRAQKQHKSSNVEPRKKNDDRAE